ncbi:hypothetical protein B1A42_16920 [Serratia marcescens]|nr:hypothetical protein B1A42_16920 [Serratia marcescens]
MKWTNRIIIGLVIVLLTLVVLLLISTLYYSTDMKMELGSLTDWIIAGANVAMATTAVISAILWFNQKAKLNTLDISHRLAFDFENHLWTINERLYSNILFRNKILDDIKSENLSQAEVRSLIFKEISRKTTTDLSEIAYLYSSIRKLERHNVNIKPILKDVFNDILKARLDYLNSHYRYLHELAFSQDNLESEKVVSMKNILEEKKKVLSNIFENKLAKLDINKDYEFNPAK